MALVVIRPIMVVIRHDDDDDDERAQVSSLVRVGRLVAGLIAIAALKSARVQWTHSSAMRA